MKCIIAFCEDFRRRAIKSFVYGNSSGFKQKESFYDVNSVGRDESLPLDFILRAAVWSSVEKLFPTPLDNV